MSDIDIVEVARRSGVSASALRFYEQKGLIASVGRRGLRRLFDPEVFERLALVALGRAAGFSLEEISRMLSPGAGPTVEKAALAAKADELDGLIERLARMRDGLRHAASCPAPTLLDCPTFRRFMKVAGSGRLQPPAARRIYRAEPV